MGNWREWIMHPKGQFSPYEGCPDPKPGIWWEISVIGNEFDVNVFKNSSKLTIFGIFDEFLVHSKSKLSSLRSQCWMRLFGQFSNTVFFSFTYIDEDVHLLVLVGELQLFATFDRFIYEVELLQFFTNRSIVAVVRSHC